MATEGSPDDREVYMIFNNIFQGQDSQIRKPASIKRLVTKHQEEPQVAQLLEQYSAPIIYDKLKTLLGDQVFESTLKAKEEFPELFEVSRAQSAERAISEAEAAADHAKAVEEALTSSDSNVRPYYSDHNSGKIDTDPVAEEFIGSLRKQESARLGTSVPSLFPLEFPFITGHKILIKTQEVLEHACFRFAETAMPEILEKRKWHYPESAELNLWAKQFSKRQAKLGKVSSMGSSPSRPLKEVLSSVAQIRHHAVHRIPVTAKELERFMVDGETLVQLFEDRAATHVMSRARSEVHAAAAELENKKNMLEARLNRVLQDIDEKRAKLDRAEAEAIADMQQKDKEYQLLAGTHLQENIWLDDGAAREDLCANESPTTKWVDMELIADQVDTALDQVDAALDSEIVSQEKSRIKKAVEEGSVSSVFGMTFIGNGHRDGIPEELEEITTGAPEVANAHGDRVETGKQELSSNTSENIHGPEVSKTGWPNLFNILGTSTVDK